MEKVVYIGLVLPVTLGILWEILGCILCGRAGYQTVSYNNCAFSTVHSSFSSFF